MKALGAGVAVVVGALLAGEAAAQTKEILIQAGDRIRYRTASGSKERAGKALVLETGPDWLRVEDKRGAFQIDKSALQSLAVLRGKHRNPVGGAMIGFLPAALFGAFAAGSMCDYGSDCNVLPAALVVGGMGAVVGAGVGALVKTDRWVNAPMNRVRFGVAPVKGGVRAALSLSF